MSTRPLELCRECGEPTGKAGRGEDSIYLGSMGPFCEECYEGLDVVIENLHAELARLRAIEAAARELIGYETAGAPDYLDWDEKFETLRAALAPKEANRG